MGCCGHGSSVNEQKKDFNTNNNQSWEWYPNDIFTNKITEGDLGF